MVASMNPNVDSRSAVVLPQGALFRKSAEGKIRKALLEQDLIECVIGLAPNLFYGTSLAGSIVIMRRKKTEARKNKVLIIDASTLFEKAEHKIFSIRNMEIKLFSGTQISGYRGSGQGGFHR